MQLDYYCIQQCMLMLQDFPFISLTSVPTNVEYQPQGDIADIAPSVSSLLY